MTVLQYKWEFGDGNISYEKEPTHIYKMAGEYTAIRTITGPFGDQINSVTVYVYEWAIGEGLHVVYADKCFRHAVKHHQGIGQTEYTGGAWIWPEAYVGTVNGKNKINETISLVMDTRAGKHYRIGVKEQWLDRQETIYNEDLGYEIESSFTLPEHINPLGERRDSRHIESFVHFRPIKKEYMAADGYTNEGYRKGFRVNLNHYVDGVVNPSARIKDVPLKGDLEFRKTLDGARHQTEIVVETSAFRCIGVEEDYVDFDKQRGPEENTKTETLWQREFETPDLWVTRDSVSPTLNRASGVNTGTYDSFLVGPDNYTNSAINLVPANSLSLTLNDISQSTVTWWIKDIVSALTVFDFNGITIGFDGNYDLDIDGFIVPVEWDINEWTFFSITMGDRVEVKVNKNDYGTFGINLGNVGGATQILGGSVASVFDIRRVPRIISGRALGGYYDSVIDDRGDSGFLPVMR